ncbi:Integumentary mucin A.1 [Fusarium oxysporum f. sp. albedinis]|nr:Integumentary mucin A.1 [Fusarium oxysporum f. sp. albedinis]
MDIVLAVLVLDTESESQRILCWESVKRSRRRRANVELLRPPHLTSILGDATECFCFACTVECKCNCNCNCDRPRLQNQSQTNVLLSPGALHLYGHVFPLPSCLFPSKVAFNQQQLLIGPIPSPVSLAMDEHPPTMGPRDQRSQAISRFLLASLSGLQGVLRASVGGTCLRSWVCLFNGLCPRPLASSLPLLLLVHSPLLVHTLVPTLPYSSSSSSSLWSNSRMSR